MNRISTKFTLSVVVAILLLTTWNTPLKAQRLSVGQQNVAASDDQNQPLRFSDFTRDDRSELLQAGADLDDPKSLARLAPQYYATPPVTGSERAMACPAAFIMNTPYNSNNGQRGCMFDVFAANAVTIRCFEVNLYAGTTANYEIYYRTGTHVGNENNAAAWTFIGGVTGITSAGNNLPTAIPININVAIPAGATYSFYITNDFGGGTSYTDGTAVGNFLAADANLTVYEGVGKSYPFGLTFTVRNFNGHIFYDLGGSLDANEASLSGQAVDGTAELSWEISEAVPVARLALERAPDGLRFEKVANLDTDLRTARFSDRPDTDHPTWFYRLRITDPSGQTSYSNVAEVQLQAQQAWKLTSVYPNPTTGQAHVALENNRLEALDIRITDQLGKVVHSSTHGLETGRTQVGLDLRNLPAGMYYLQATSDGHTEVRSLIRQ